MRWGTWGTCMPVAWAWKQATPPRWSGSGRRAEKNQASALYGLGYMHLSGMGVPRDARKAFKYFTLAAEQVRLPAPEAGSCCKPSRCTWRGECNCLGFAPGSISTLHSGPACVTALARVLKLPSSEACQPQISFCELRLANHSSC